MSNLAKSVNKTLAQMKKHKSTDKGSFGELAVLNICEELYQKGGGILYHSFVYKVDKSLPGNLKSDGGKLYLENLGSTTEVDVLLVTPYAIFLIEVKAYKAKEIVLTDSGISGCAITNKSPVHQNEMHARHLYSHLFKCIPDGETKYIIPIVTFVDKCKVLDKRSKEQKNYVYVSTLNSVGKLIEHLNVYKGYLLDLDAVDKALTQCSCSYERKFNLLKR